MNFIQVADYFTVAHRGSSKIFLAVQKIFILVKKNYLSVILVQINFSQFSEAVEHTGQSVCWSVETQLFPSLFGHLRAKF